MSQTTILITGANRGIGRGLAARFLLRPSTTIIALIRAPSHETSESLSELPTGENSRIITLPYDATIAGSASEATHTLRTIHSIDKLDMVIANAGINEWVGPSVTATPADFLQHFNTNTIGPILIFQATYTLLQKSSIGPKFVAISTAIGSTGQMQKYAAGKCVPYGTSKAALNHAMVRFSIEHPDIMILMLTPGRVQTGLGSGRFKGRPGGVPLDDSVGGLIQEIDMAGKEGGMTTGQFREWNGDVVPW